MLAFSRREPTERPLRDADAVAAATWRRARLIAAAVILTAWAIYLVQFIRGNVEAGSTWFLALVVGNFALALGRHYVERKERRAG
jgi:hypothetical protein